MGSLWEDIVFAWRNALKKPNIALLIIATFTLGIGANSAIFSVVYNILLAPLPYADGDRLVRLQQHQPLAERIDMASSVKAYFDYKNLSSSMSDILEYHAMEFTLYGYGDPIRVQTGVVSWNYFDVLGIRPIMGRTFVEGEDEIGAEPLIVITKGFWEKYLDGDLNIVGKSLEMNNRTHKIIGILPNIPSYPDNNDIYISSASCPFRTSDTVLNSRDATMLNIYGKLKPGISIEQGSRDINNIAQQLASEYPDAYPENKGYSASLITVKDEMIGDSAKTFYLLLAVAGMVILIASANVANLNLARLATRTQELAIREALGADRRRIAQQLLTESTLFSIIGGLLGLALAYPSFDMLADFAASYTPLSSEVKMDGSVLIFTLVLSIVTGVLSGSAAAFNRRNISTTLKEGGDKVTTSTSGKRIRNGLLILQFALSLVILTTSFLVTTSLFRLNTQETGFMTDNILVVSFNLNFSNYTDRTAVRGFASQLLNQVEGMPGVERITIAGSYPLASNLAGPVPFETEAQGLSEGDVRSKATVSVVSEGYHEVLNITLLEGRLFTRTDDENSEKVVIINQTMVNSYFSGMDAVGQRISTDEGENWLRVVGVVTDVRSVSLDKTEGDKFYIPFAQRPTSQVRLMLKTQGDSMGYKEAVTNIIHQIDPQQAIASVMTMKQIREQWLASPKLIAILIGLFGLLAFFITLSGVVGVVTYNVSHRFREIGIRMAVGATPKDIMSMLLVQEIKISLLGIVLGVTMMVLITPFIEKLLYQTNPYDPLIYGVSLILLLVMSVLAMVLPARQGTKLDPAHTLRNE